MYKSTRLRDELFAFFDIDMRLLVGLRVRIHRSLAGQ